MEKFLIFVLCVFAVVETTEIYPKIILTSNGPVQGIVKQSRNPDVKFVRFLGLRYAEPPKRFEDAKLLEKKWTTPKLANVPGDICLQEAGGSEDCLYINIYAPLSALENTTAEPLPVMFFIHGGGFTFGEGGLFGGEYLLENGKVILATINYRLGSLGFISYGEHDRSFNANNGLRDIIIALKWVQKNIASFNGNSNAVTLWGQSAGSAAVYYLMMSNLSKDLFHRAILQSGAHSFWSYQPSPRENAVGLAKYLNCTHPEDSAATRKCLEDIGGAELVQAQMACSPRWPANYPVSRFVPTAREPQANAFFAGEPSSFFTAHKDNISPFVIKVPVIMGTVRDEGSNSLTSFVIAKAGQLEHLNDNWSQIAPKAISFEPFFTKDQLIKVSDELRKEYFGDNSLTLGNLDPLVNLYTDFLYRMPIFTAIHAMTKSGITVYPYIYTNVGPNFCTKKFGVPVLPNKAGHCDDLQMLFTHPIFGDDRKIIPGSKQEQLSQRMVTLWTSFAGTGVPRLDRKDDNTTWNSTKLTKDGKSIIFDILELNSRIERSRKFDPQQVLNQINYWSETFQVILGKETKMEL